MVKNLPCNAGENGSTPGSGRSHMPRSSSACVPQLLSPHVTTAEAMCLEPVPKTREAPRTGSLCTPARNRLCAAQTRQSQHRKDSLTSCSINKTLLLCFSRKKYKNYLLTRVFKTHIPSFCLRGRRRLYTSLKWNNLKRCKQKRPIFKTKLETTTTCESSHPKTYLQAPSRV